MIASIKQLALELKLGYIRSNLEEELKEAKHLKKEYEEFLNDLLSKERERQFNNGIKHRIREAKFPYKKYCVDFRKAKFSKAVKQRLEELETLDFIDSKENVILMSNPGMGKTHFAIGLGMKACLEGKKVLYTSIPNLIIELKEAISQNQLTQIKKKFEKVDLVILDEFGYVSFDKEGSEILFNLISNRISKGSIVLTTNLSFDRWDEIFQDSILTAAIVDRLAHKSHVIDMRGDSYRIEETKEWLKAKNSQ